jgi:hypothetical protein
MGLEEGSQEVEAGGGEHLPTSAVTGTVELELTVAQAKQLVVVFQAAIEAAEHAYSPLPRASRGKMADEPFR